MESLCVIVVKSKGEQLRNILVSSGLIDHGLKIRTDKENIYIPVKSEIGHAVIKQIESAGIQIKQVSVMDFLPQKRKDTPKGMLGFSPSYEIIGDIAIIDAEDADADKIAEALIREDRVRTVLGILSPVSGEFRTREFKIMAGDGRTGTEYREHGCRYRLDVARVYFTPRLSTERLRVAVQVKKGETVIDMFAGVGPFSILIAKKSPGSRIFAIDKNPEAVKYLKENIRLNKAGNVTAIEGDAHEIAPSFKDLADHVIMNLPHSAFEFLQDAFLIARRGGIIHYYDIRHEDDLFGNVLDHIKGAAAQSGKTITLKDTRIVRPYAPYQYNICVEFWVI